MGTIILQEIYHIFMLILCSQIFIRIFLWSSSGSSNSVRITRLRHRIGVSSEVEKVNNQGGSNTKITI
jgi:hypothetical protein